MRRWDWEKIGKKFGPALILAGLTVYFFRSAFLPPLPDWVLSRPEGDVASLYYYWRAFGFQALLRGVLPLWNPEVMCGSAFLAYPEAALFYPLNLIFLCLPLARALNLSFILHFFLLGFFQYRLVRYLGSRRFSSLLAAVVVIFSAPVVLHFYAGHLSNICTLAWIPLLFLLAERFRRRGKLLEAGGAGLVLALQLLAGHWQYAYYSGLLVFIYLGGDLAFNFRRRRKEIRIRLTGLALIPLVAGGLAAIQLLPALAISRDSFRRLVGYDFAANFSLPPLNLLTFFLPGLLGDSVSSMYWGRFYFWEMCAYAGFIPLLLAGIALGFRRDRLTRAWAGIGIAGVILALGAYTPLHRVLYLILPGFRLFRGSAKLIFFAVFALSVLSARGTDWLQSRLRSGKRSVFAWIALAVLLGAVSAFCFPGSGEEAPPRWWRSSLKKELLRGRHYDLLPPGRPAWWKDLMSRVPPGKNYPLYVERLVEGTPFARNSWALFQSETARLGRVLLLFCLILIGVYLTRRRLSFPLLLALLVTYELLPWAGRFVTGFDSGICRWPPGEKEFFRSESNPYRFLSFDPGDYNRGMLTGFPSLIGYQADVSRRYLEYINASQNLPTRPEELLPAVNDYSELLGLLNLTYLIVPAAGESLPPPFREVWRGPDRVIWRNQNASARALISSRARVIRDRRRILAQLKNPGYDPAGYIILEEAPPAGGGGEGRVRIIESDLNRTLLAVEVNGPAFLLLNDSYAPGWKAYLDGRASKIYRANYLARAVFIPAGKHRVEFRYLPPAFLAGAAISLLTALSLVLLIVFRRRIKLARGGDEMLN